MSTFFLIVLELANLVLFVVLLFVVALMRKRKAERDELAQQKEVIFGFVHDVGEVFAEADIVDMDLMLKRILFYALRTTHAGAGAIFLVDHNGETLRAESLSGIFPPLLPGSDVKLEHATSKSQYIEQIVRAQRIRMGEGLVGEVADFCAPVLIEDAERDPRVPQYRQDFLKVRSILLVPMRFHQDVLGVLAVVNRVDGRPFVQTDLNLMQALADQASVSIHFAELRESLDEKQRIDHDLDVSRRIQTALLPKEIPRISGVELAAFNYPALEVGGDYYDFIPVDEHRLGIAIADVSGKGVSGAIMMAMCRSTLRAQARGCMNPADVLRAVNEIMYEDIAEDMFISILYAIFNPENGELVMARAGHERPIIAHEDGSRLEVLDLPGIAMGLGSRDEFDKVLEEKTLILENGDVMVAYTDGVTEAMNSVGNEWGIDNFMDAIRVAAAEGANSILNNVRQRLMRFVGNTDQYDDMTLIALRVMR